MIYYYHKLFTWRLSLDNIPNKYNLKNDFANNIMLMSGAICAAAAKAAAASLLLHINYDSVEFVKNNGTKVKVPVRFVPHPENGAIREYAVIMNQIQTEGLIGVCEVHVSVERIRKLSDIPDMVYINPQYINLYLDGGQGIAKNLEKKENSPRGFYAIDKEARDLIFQSVADISTIADAMPLLMIRLFTVSFQNAGSVLNGISGADGFVTPLSQNDILMDLADSIKEQYDRGIRNILAVPGNSGHKYIQDQIHISLANSIRCRNYIGNAIDMASAAGMENFLLVGNASKLIRLAAGIMDTHTWVADGRREILSLHTVLSGGTISQARIIQELSTTDQMLAKLTEWGLREQVMASVCVKIADYLRNRIGGAKMNFGVIPVHEKYGILGQTPDISRVLASVSREQFALSIKK